MEKKTEKTLICAACSLSNRCKLSFKSFASKLVSPFPITSNRLRLSSTNQKNQENRWKLSWGSGVVPWQG